MISGALFKKEAKSSLPLWLIIATVNTLYFSIIVWMFDPELGSALKTFEEAMPELMAMFGMVPASENLTQFMGAYLYGMIMQIFPMIFIIILANRLIAKHVDSGSMAYLLAAPISRVKLALTQLAVLLSGLILMILYCTGLGIVLSEIMFPGELNIGGFVLLNVGCLFLQICIMGICFLSSCAANETKWSLAFGAGVPVFAYVLQMLSTQGEAAENFKYATFFTLFNTSGLINAESTALLQAGALLVIGAVLSAIGVIVFKRKDLHI
ncbi:MAG: ABC transporter permease subunit [Eubacteriales bacterium]|nr:ABC transporter permease subunit [Eubacteriales bacterium]